jgi:cytosine/adenosine deaminase-related metal-dependent hydrolase
VNVLHSYGLLKDDILLSHASQAEAEDAARLLAAHAHVSATPDVELQMGHGIPVCFRPDLHTISSLGIDCHSNNSADMLSQMRLALQSARGTRNQQFVEQGKLPRAVGATVEQAFNLGTIMGARAVGMGAEIGSIGVGKLADIVVFDGQSPGMICAAEHDPVAAVVLHASVRDIETVVVDGQIRKLGGKLVSADVDDRAEGPMDWPQVAVKLLHSRQRLEEMLEAADKDGARKAVMELLHVDEKNIFEHL